MVDRMEKWLVYDIDWDEDYDWLPTSKVVVIEDNDVSDFNNKREIEDFIHDTLQWLTGCNLNSFGYKVFEC